MPIIVFFIALERVFLPGHQISLKNICCTDIFRTFVFGCHSDYRL